MRIYGLWAEDADRLHPEQWVNVYEVGQLGNAEYYCTCQVKDLDLAHCSDYGLEPIDPDGNPIAPDIAMGEVAA